MEEVVWKDVVGYEGLYQVSNTGVIVSNSFRNGNCLRTRQLRLKQVPDRDGYFRVTLCKDNKRHGVIVHRVVAEAFLENPNCYPVVNHKDENKQNNNAANLEWCTVRYNTRYNDSHIRRFASLRKPIRQLSMRGEFIKDWPCRAEIQRDTGITPSNITLCCLGKRRSAGGFKWEYAG